MFQSYSDTDRDILDNFYRNFSFLKKEPIILYGLGEKTKLLLEGLKDFRFIALMDKQTIGTTVFNLPVIAPDEAPKFSKNIIIVCKYASKDIVFNRISHLLSDGITIWYMNGEKFERNTVNEISFEKNLEDLEYLIKTHDIISFDLFDTLLLRRLPSPSDIFKYIEMQGYPRFGEKRIYAEKLAKKKYGIFYTLDNIYEFIDNKKIKEIEITTEITFCTPNTEIIAFLKLAQSLNKKVFITSDMYLPEDVIFKMLNHIDILGDFTLNLSNKNHLSKYQGEIYQHYIKKNPSKKILHIGDDEFSDVYQPNLFGISSFLIPQGTKHLSKFLKTIHDKIVYGIILAKCKDNFSDKLKCLTMTDFGYFIAPLILNYLNWLYKKVKDKNVDKILFISRDGYLLKQLYQLYPEPKPLAVYFYTSRRALGVCSIQSEKDIIDTFNVYYLSRRISIKQFISAAFGVDVNDEFSNKYVNDIAREDLLKYILSLSEKILTNAHKEYKEYKEYIDSICTEKEILGIINFVGSGTTQFFAEKLFENKLLFFYFQTTSDIKKNKINLDNSFSCYGNFLSPFLANNTLTCHYHDLEAILTSPEEQFVKFDNGKKVFYGSENHNFKNIKASHESIVNFFDEIIKLNKDWWKVDYSLDFINNLLNCPFTNINTVLNPAIKEYFTITDGFAQSQNPSILC